MPNAFVGAPQQSLRANTLAAIRELNYFQTRDDKNKLFSVIRHLSRRLKCTASPFDFLYLVDAVAQDGHNLERPEKLFPMIVDALFTRYGKKIPLSSFVSRGGCRDHKWDLENGKLTYF
jgi:hypothetical protein